jgi:hypothetical protein
MGDRAVQLNDAVTRSMMELNDPAMDPQTNEGRSLYHLM